MSLDRSLKVSANLSGKRSVLTRAERIEKMKTDKRWDDKKNTALNIPKTLVGKG
jgi:small basic protein (TIGR04137 family)